MRFIAAALSLLISTSAFAQVMFLPVQSQFSTGYGDEKYYYGGTDPRVHMIARNNGCGTYHYSLNLHRFDGGNSFGQPSPLYDRTAIYTDCAPFGQDVSHQGFSPADAQNEANANAARYYRKSDQLAAAIVLPDGSRLVPPTPVMIVPLYGDHSTMMSSTLPVRRGQVIIIPKRMLDRPLKDFTNPPVPQKVASARD